MTASLDARKSLGMLAEEWSQCTACGLGERRAAQGLRVVPGRGTTRGLLLLGEGPGWREEIEGEPFVGAAGLVLSQVLAQWHITRLYKTNLVACRSCAPRTYPDGTPMMTRGGRGRPPEIRLADEAPKPPEVAACRPRLLEEIYLVDPYVIVTLGTRALEGLTQRPVPSIQGVRGKPLTISLPGVSHRVSLTEKRQQWVRKVRGTTVAPTVNAGVRYLVIPTVHPSFVLSKIHHDRQDDSPLTAFAADLYAAVRLYRAVLAHHEGIHESTDVPTTADPNALPEGISLEMIDDEIPTNPSE